MNKIAQTFYTTTLILCFLSPASFAQQPQYTGGMKYTTMRPAQPGDADKKPVYNRKPAEEGTKAEDAPPEETVEKTPEQSAWDKYKELASGKKPEDEKNNALPEAPEKPTPPSTQAAKEEPQQPTGMSSIIQDYQRNKQKRSQMRSISFANPEEPTVEKPSVEKPEKQTD